MISRIRLTLIACLFLLAVPVLGQDMSQTVLPISELKWIGPGVEAKFGTGFCLDAECRFIGTNYHVAVLAHPRKIKGQKVIQRYLATGPDDDGATMNDRFAISPLKYAPGRDLAIFELNHPLARYHGIAFSLKDLQIGQPVDIYAFPKESINPFRSLLKFHGAFKGETTGGLWAFDYSLSTGKALRPGASGGLVVDSKTQQVVGVLSSVAKNDEEIALAVPIQSLADFVSKVEPWLASKIFPSANKKIVSPALADLYPKFVWPTTGLLQHRSEESADIKLLRQKAQLLANSIRNFIAVQTFAWGSGANETPTAVAEYEVQVLDGFQRFRDRESKEEFQDVPLPPVNTVVGTGGEWSELPQMVGTKLQLKIHQFPDTVVSGRRLKVFQYRAEAEDGVPCNFFDAIRDYGFFTKSKIVRVPCYGEVWADEDANILRISEHIELAGSWKDHGTVITYGWLRRADEVPRLIPVTISAEAEYHRKVYWCRGVFTNYRVFSAETKIVSANESMQQTATYPRPGVP